MKSITLQPFSLSIGLAMALLALVTMGQGSQPLDVCSGQQDRFVVPPTSQWVRIELGNQSSGATYTVPIGKNLLPTYIVGSDGGNGTVHVRGPAAQGNETYLRGLSPLTVPIGTFFSSGETINANTADGLRYTLWGYLVDE